MNDNTSLGPVQPIRVDPSKVEVMAPFECVILTPKGDYRPGVDNLLEAISGAAKFAGLSNFRLFFDGAQVMSPTDLPCQKVSDIPKMYPNGMPEIRLDPYDRAG